MDEMRARRRGTVVMWFWIKDAGMLDGRYSIPDLDGVFVRDVFDHMIDQMKPVKGQPWATRAQRGADALVELCRNYADVHAVGTPNWRTVVEVRAEGPATVAGIPIADEVVEGLLAQASVEPVLVDEAVNRSRMARRSRRSLRRRCGRCGRGMGIAAGPDVTVSPGCRCITSGPRAGVDTTRRRTSPRCAPAVPPTTTPTRPARPYLLLGNPNQVDGLRLIHRDDLPALAALAAAEANAHQSRVIDDGAACLRP